MSKRNTAGFTIIELLIVAAIIGLLSAVVLQSLNTARQRSRNATRLSQIDQINKAMELFATGGQNKLPYSGGPAEWRCLGLDTVQNCSGGFTGHTATSNAVRSNISGGVVPKDPNISGSIGEYYLYNSNTPDLTGDQCSPTTCPAGAYLSWVTESGGTCGRGKRWQPATNGTQCVLRIGDRISS